MKITRIRVDKAHLSYFDGACVWGADNIIATAQTAVVVIDTDAGITGCGEFCPCGGNCMVAQPEGAESQAWLIAPRRSAHVAASTPERPLPNSIDLMNDTAPDSGLGSPSTREGGLCTTDAPGLGVTPDFTSLGAPVLTYGERT